MLKFYGIRFNKQGAPERFTISFALRESLNAGLYIYDRCSRDVEKCLKAIDGEIDALFRSSDVSKRLSGLFRLTVSKWFRTRDIIRFICGDKSRRRTKLAVARSLNRPEEISVKWERIERILINRLARLNPADRDEELANPESDLHLLLQMIGLFFLEQDDEMPPANLELQFLRNQFPKVIWKKKDGFSAASSPFWVPENPYCRVSWLANRIVSRVAARTDLTAADPSLPLPAEAQQRQPAAAAIPFSFTSLMPAELPDELRLEFEGDENRRSQLSFLPETAAETLLSLQKMIQKRFWHDGVKHLMAIFRQIAENASAGMCEFDVERHLQLISRSKRNGRWSEKQQTVLRGVLATLLQLRVKRRWKSSDPPREMVNPFILEICCESRPECEGLSLRRLLLDPIFCPGQNNPFRLGGHLTLIPVALFQESIHKHALLPGLASYITGVWLNDFSRDRGVLVKSTREMIEGAAFNVTAASKYRILHKIKSELAYMAEKCYISDYTVMEDAAGNPWNDKHRLSAPEPVMAAITDCIQLNQANPHPERLIA